MVDEKVPEPAVMPCGCRSECQIIDGVRTLIWVACPSGEACEWVQFVLAESARQERPSTVLDAS